MRIKTTSVAGDAWHLSIYAMDDSIIRITGIDLGSDCLAFRIKML